MGKKIRIRTDLIKTLNGRVFTARELMPVLGFSPYTNMSDAGLANPYKPESRVDFIEYAGENERGEALWKVVVPELLWLREALGEGEYVR